MKKSVLFIATGLMIAFTGTVNPAKGQEFSQEKARSVLDHAVKHYKNMMHALPFNKLPRTIDVNGDLITSGSAWWCSGFYPGSLWYLYEYTGDDLFKQEATRRTMLIEKEKYNKGTHDLGFMLYCSFGNGYRLTGNSNFKDIIITGSESLITRFRPNVGCIQSWDWAAKWQCPVIIDNMMNLEMLLFASAVSGNPKYKKIAIKHANTTIKNHFRDDYSTYHVIDYDTASGEVLHRNTHQGFSDESAWTRGQAWGLYGYTMMFRETGKKEYLVQAEAIAGFILDHINLPDDMVPYWDFDAPNIPDAKRDASSAAIIASALIDLSTLTENDSKQRYLEAAKKMMASLASDQYLAKTGANGNFLLKHSVGSLPGKSEVDVPLTYADYYYIEALIKYLHLK